MIKIRLRKKMPSAAVLLFSLLLVFSCQSGRVHTSTLRADIKGIEKILVFPFKDMAAVYGENVNVRSPLGGNIFMTGKVEQGATDFLTDRVVSLMKANTSYEIIPPGQACCIVSDLPLKNKAQTLSELELIVETGLAAGADAVLMGYLYRFEDRVGTRYSVDSPASVTFSVHLVKLLKADKSGRIVWMGHFEETQLPLFENLLKLGTFVKRGGKWLTAYEMAAAGLDEVLATLPKQP